jgi:membrane fusion protein (multidrug efflux system)
MSQTMLTATMMPQEPTPRMSAEPQVATPREAMLPAVRAAKFRVPLWMPLVACGFLAAAAYVYVPAMYVVDTDDAYVTADTVAVVPKVAAYVSALHVTDNSAFKAGQLLVELDPRDFQVALESATADLRSAEAARQTTVDQLREQGDMVAAAQAAVDSDRATLAFAGQQFTRYTDLARTGFGTVERAQQAKADISQREAALQHDLNTLAGAQSHTVVLQSQIAQADAAIARAQAGVDQARLNLSYTKIYATSAGSVANRSVQAGNFVQPGQTLFSAVPDDAYVIANFKETQLARMQVGQPVTVRVDAFPGRPLRAHVDSFQRGTGSAFALLPPENATGNFVKVVQRVPVKIVFDEPADVMRRIAPGMSVEPTVAIASPPRWLGRLLGL